MHCSAQTGALGERDLAVAPKTQTAKAVKKQECVTVLFCNIHEFHTMVLSHQGWELVTLLDSIYTASPGAMWRVCDAIDSKSRRDVAQAFDEVASDFGIEKMETVGEVAPAHRAGTRRR